MKPRRKLVAAALALVAAAVAAQDPLSQFFDAVEVRVIDLDVVVVDRDGAPVRGLLREDFTVLEDGRPVEVTQFTAYDEARLVDAPPGAEAPAPAAGAEGDDAAIAPAPSPSATWLIYVDQGRLRPGRRNQVVVQVRRFLESALRPGDRSMVASWDGDSLHVASPLSADVQWPLAALDALARQSGARASLHEQQATTLRHDINAAAPLSINTISDKPRRDFGDPDAALVSDGSNPFETRPGTAVQAESLLRQIEALEEMEVQRTRASISGLRDLLVLTSGIEGRLGVVLVGAGFSSEPVENLYRLWDSRFRRLDPQARAGPIGARATEVADEYARLLGALRSSRATVFAVDAGEDLGGTDVAESAGAGTALAGASHSVSASADSRSSLQGLVDATGGRMFVGGPDLAEALTAARRDLVTYYSLGYRPEGDAPAARRKLDVQVRVPGARVLHRREIAPRGAPEDAAASALAALLATDEDEAAGRPATPSALVIEAGESRRAERGDARIVPITVRVPLDDLTLIADGATHRGRLSFYLAVEQPDGGYGRLEPRQLALDLSNEQLEKSLGQTVNYRIDVGFASPGAHRVAVAVLDEPSGERWTGIAWIQVGGGG